MRESDGGHQRRLLWSEFSKGKVDMLRELRDELSSRRWEIMLEIHEAKRLVRLTQSMAEDQELRTMLAELFDTLDGVHSKLARIPEDLIPPF
ncbi:MAG: hypothetical protein GTO14_17155 [Anaerolineales bacterium]|nr:hypothetical protein [Anaerolineales bacterium]